MRRRSSGLSIALPYDAAWLPASTASGTVAIVAANVHRAARTPENVASDADGASTREGAPGTLAADQPRRAARAAARANMSLPAREPTRGSLDAAPVAMRGRAGILFLVSRP